MRSFRCWHCRCPNWLRLLIVEEYEYGLHLQSSSCSLQKTERDNYFLSNSIDKTTHFSWHIHEQKTNDLTQDDISKQIPLFGRSLTNVNRSNMIICKRYLKQMEKLCQNDGMAIFESIEFQLRERMRSSENVKWFYVYDSCADITKVFQLSINQNEKQTIQLMPQQFISRKTTPLYSDNRQKRSLERK